MRLFNLACAASATLGLVGCSEKAPVPSGTKMKSPTPNYLFDEALSTRIARFGHIDRCWVKWIVIVAAARDLRCGCE